MMQLTDGEAPVLVERPVELDHTGMNHIVVSAQVDASRRFHSMAATSIASSPFRPSFSHGDGIAATAVQSSFSATRLRALIIRFFNTKFSLSQSETKASPELFHANSLPSSAITASGRLARPWPTARRPERGSGSLACADGLPRGGSFSWSYKLRPEPGDLNTRMLSALSYASPSLTYVIPRLSIERY